MALGPCVVLKGERPVRREKVFEKDSTLMLTRNMEEGHYLSRASISRSQNK